MKTLVIPSDQYFKHFYENTRRVMKRRGEASSVIRVVVRENYPNDGQVTTAIFPVTIPHDIDPRTLLTIYYELPPGTYGKFSEYEILGPGEVMHYCSVCGGWICAECTKKEGDGYCKRCNAKLEPYIGEEYWEVK